MESLRWLGNILVLLISVAICVVAVGVLAWLFVRNSVNDRAEELSRRALEGDAEAQLELGDAAMSGPWLGIGPTRNPEQAAHWYAKAAMGDSAEAHTRLGELYLVGDGVPVDYYRAMEHFQKGAALGDPDGSYWTGRMYAEGYGVPRDQGLALEHFQRAADHGSALAMWEISLAYRYGTLGLKPDAEEAEAWRERYRSERNRALDMRVERINELLREARPR